MNFFLKKKLRWIILLVVGVFLCVSVFWMAILLSNEDSVLNSVGDLVFLYVVLAFLGGSALTGTAIAKLKEIKYFERHRDVIK